MTMCAAGICQRSSAFVTVSDRMAAWGHGGTDEPLIKAARLAPLWIALIASDGLSRGVENVIRDTRSTLKEYGDKHSVAQVRSTMMAAWRDTRNQRGEAVVLSPFRMTVNQFMTVGPNTFGAEMFRELAQRLTDESRLESTLIVCGFDENAIPWLGAQDDDSPWDEYTRAGYAAVGCGAPLALASLARQRYKRERTLKEAIYQLCVAKFEAEADPHVGRDTLVLCFRDDGKTCWILPGNANWVRELWDRRKHQADLPDAQTLSRTLDPLLNESRWMSV